MIISTQYNDVLDATASVRRKIVKVEQENHRIAPSLV
jgi:hypothetical protein